MKRAVVYARYSCSNQTEKSIEGQMARCKAYAKANDLNIICYYIDRATSATTDHRPQFLQMIKDSKEKNFDCVIVYAIDRFARNTYDHNIYKKKLADNGVYLLSTTEQLEVNPDGSENLSGIIVEGMMSSYAYYYSRELSAKIRRGREENIKKGISLGGHVSYGYEVKDKHLCPLPDEASIVQEIFSRYSSGETVPDILEYLKGIGATQHSGRPFKNTTLYAMLRNKRYIGITEYNGVEYENFYPRLIDDETFNNVQFKLAHYRRSPSKSLDTAHYILSGKLYCGKCHSLMYGESGTARNGEVYRYYKCFERKHNRTCDKANIRKEYIENLVITTTIKHLLTPENSEILVKNILDEQEERRKASPIERLKKQHTAITKKIDNIVDAIASGICSKSMQSKLAKLEEDQADLQLRIDKCSIEDELLSREQIVRWLSLFSIEDIASERTHQVMIDTFVDKVILYEDKVVIVYKRCGSEDTIPIDDVDAYFFGTSPTSTTKTDYGELRVYLGHFIAVIELD